MDSTTALSQIVVDHHDLSPVQFPGAAFKPVLAAAALTIVPNLVGGGLADIDPSLTRQVDYADKLPPRSWCTFTPPLWRIIPPRLTLATIGTERA